MSGEEQAFGASPNENLLQRHMLARLNVFGVEHLREGAMRPANFKEGQIIARWSGRTGASARRMHCRRAESCCKACMAPPRTHICKCAPSQPP